MKCPHDGTEMVPYFFSWRCPKCEYVYLNLFNDMVEELKK